jgi:hypothetical protein
MNGKGDKRRKYTKEGEDAYRSNKFWESIENDKRNKKTIRHNDDDSRFDT